MKKTILLSAAVLFFTTIFLACCKGPDHCDGLNKNLSSNPNRHRSMR